MCGSKPKTPQVVERDPVAEQAEADRQATIAANTETAARRRRRASSGGGVAAAAMRAASLGSANSQTRSLLAQARPDGG